MAVGSGMAGSRKDAGRKRVMTVWGGAVGLETGWLVKDKADSLPCYQHVMPPVATRRSQLPTA